MSNLDFDSAVEGVKKLLNRPTSDELNELYGLYKQSTVGENNSAKPSLLDLPAIAKWDAWSKLKGTSQIEAQKRYIELVNRLIQLYGTS
ncbi:acyl-CoA-binding protein [Pseudomonas sp. KBS0710]|uniref:acyl-CoA-binding domain-containing protein n=1 Tax=Pseudomonas sp. KBS0710 TaxID=1179667 RepID=UPI00110E8FBA|nr:acyl-CoA-binding protein [Pseudomonas sp. KBS0710]TSD76584.1 acyl-CoA-binding protein [Pseudomonas sp. KBS0710]